MEHAALAGVRVAVLRPQAQAAALGAALSARGARVVYCPLIRIAAPADAGALQRAAARLEVYDWVVFTSANGVRAFVAAAAERWPERPRIAAVGTATAGALAAAGLRADVVPARFEAGALAAALTRAAALAGSRVLFPRARDAGRALPKALRAAGALVDEVECYRTEPDRDGAARLATALRAGEVDALAFTSPSQVESFHASGAPLPDGVVIAAVGPVTEAAARARGLDVAVVAEPHTMTGLVDALAHWCGVRAQRRAGRERRRGHAS